MVALGTRCTLARAMREASAARMMAPSIFASSDRRWGVYSASSRNPPGADRQDRRVVTHQDQRAVLGLQNPVQALAEPGPRRDHRQRVVQRLAAAGAVGHPGIVPGAPRAPASDRTRLRASASVRTPCTVSPGRRHRGRARHGGGHQRPGEPGPVGLGQAAVGARDGAHLAGQAQLAEDDDVGRQGPVGDDRGHGQGDGQVGRGLGDGDAAHGGGEHLGRGRDLDRGAAGQDGQQQVGPRRIDAQRLGRGGPVAAAGAGAEQRLHLDQERPAALQDRHHHASRGRPPCGLPAAAGRDRARHAGRRRAFRRCPPRPPGRSGA